MNVNSIQTTPKQQSFGAGLNLLVKSHPGEIVFDGIRKALIPTDYELISTIQKRALKDDIFITEIEDAKSVAIELVKESDGQHCTSPITEFVTPEEYKTSQELGALINYKLDQMYEKVRQLRSGFRIL